MSKHSARQPDMPLLPLRSVQEVAACLGVCTKTVRRLISRRELPTTRIGSSIRISEEALRAYLKAAGSV